MKLKQIGTVLSLSVVALVASFFASWIPTDQVSAKSLSYNLACDDDSEGLTVTKQAAKHQIVVRCKSGSKFTYINNSDTAKNKVTATCPGGEQVGTDVDVPNGSSSRMEMYCVNVSLGGGEAHSTRTKNMPTAKTSVITPPGADDEEECDGDCSVLTDPVAGDDCGGVDTAIIKCNASNSGDISDNGIWALLLIAINIMTAGVGVLAVGGIVYGAILYTTAEDKADQVKKATDIITNVIIGLIAFALMWAGLNFLIPGGVFAA